MEWFYSSLAQSVAAIVGIFAAFIITKVISSQTEFRRKRVKVRKEINVSRSVRDRCLFLNFPWYCKWQLEFQLDAIEEDLAENKPLAPEEYYRELSFPKFLPRSEVLAAINERLTKVKQAERSEPPSYGKKFVRSVTDEGDKIAEAIVEALHQIRMSAALLSEVEDDPESSPLVNFSVLASLVLFFTGLILPLALLPMVSDGPPAVTARNFFAELLTANKGLLLLIPSVIFTGIMLVFLWINMQLKYEHSEIEELYASTELGYYSRYFDEMLANEKAQAEWAREQA